MSATDLVTVKVKKDSIRLVALLMTSSVTVMSGTTIVAVMPKISVYFQDVPNTELLVRLLLTTPFLFTAITAPIAGYVVDRLGRKLILILSVIVFGIAGTSGLYLNSLFTLIIGRALLGISIGGILTACIALTADYYKRDERQRMMGVQVAFMGFGAVVFLSLGGALGDIHWRAPFLSYAIAAIILPGCIFYINEPENIEKQETHISKVGKDKFPYLIIISIYFLNFIHISVFYLIPVLIPFFLQDLSYTRSFHIGLILAGMNLLSALISLTYGKLKLHFSFLEIAFSAFLFLGIGFIIISFSTGLKMILFGLIITSLSLGLFWPNANLWVNTVIPFQFRGRAIGMLATCTYLGMFLSPNIAQPFTTYYGIATTFGIIGTVSTGLGIILFLFSLKNGQC